MEHGWRGSAWHAFALFNGIVGTISMVLAIALTLYSMGLYLRTYGPMVRQMALAPSGNQSRRT
jgi:hypothetical protein